MLSKVKLLKYMTNEEVNILVKDYIILKDEVYLGSNFKHNWICLKCGRNIKERTWDNIKYTNNTLCVFCRDKVHEKHQDKSSIKLYKNMTKEEVNKETFGYIEFLDDIFITSHNLYNWKCTCGNIIQKTWVDIKFKKNGHKCDKCLFEETEKNYKTIVESSNEYKYIKSFRKNDVLPNGKIVKGSPYVQIKHLYCNSVYEVVMTAFKTLGSRCTKCCGSYENSFAHHIEVELGIKLEDVWDFKKNTVNPYHVYKSSRKKVWINCFNEKTHNSYLIRVDAFHNGTRCPLCSTSRGEVKIRETLNKNKIDSKEQVVFDGLVGLGRGLLSYDFYLPNYNLLIEYQGEQHERFIKGIHKTKQDFLKQQEHDRRKRQYAKDNNIELLEIWYYDFDKIEDILKEKLIIE